MERYRNLGGNSNVRAYELEPDGIKVQFNDGSVYLYNPSSAGSNAIAALKRLAVAGRGLNSYINKNAKHGYAGKLR